MSLKDIGKYDVSEETQAFKDKLASQETENAGLRSRLMKKEAELDEMKATLHETLHKLSTETDRALCLENDLARRSDDLKMEKMTSRNAEIALATAQDKLKAEERTVRELEATLDTMACQSETARVQTSQLESEKHSMESRVRELQRMLENMEQQPPINSRLPKRGGRPRSSSVSNPRLPALEQELNDTKVLMAQKDKTLRDIETKLARAQDDLVKTQISQISAAKAMQARIAELTSMLDDKSEELEVLKANQGTGDAIEREEELMKRIDEDEAKIAALESLLREQQRGPTQAAYDKVQGRLRAESEKLNCSEKRVRDLTGEKREAQDACAMVRQELDRVERQLQDSENRVKALTAIESGLQKELTDIRSNLQSTQHPDEDHMDVDIEDIRSNFDSSSLSPGRSYPTAPTTTSSCAHPDQTVLANYLETLLVAVDRLRLERDDLRRALQFSETEAEFTVRAMQKRIDTLTQKADEVSTHNHQSKRLLLCITALGVVVNHLRTRLYAAEQTNPAMDTSGSHSISEQCAALQDVRSQLDLSRQQLTASEESRNNLMLLVAKLEAKVQSLIAEAQIAESSHKDTHNAFQQTEEQLAGITRSYQNIESERNSLSLQVNNLQADLEAAQEELTNAQSRYSVLQTQQLSTMSASGVAHALREQIQVLEGRVNRRTEQIGIHQHDIRRLETNLKLQEDRISEMTSELEMMSAQKEAMVEDCAEARDARDQAVSKSEAAEFEVERLLEEIDGLKVIHSDELTSMVAIITQAMSNARRSQSTVDQHIAKEEQMLTKINVLTAHNSKLSGDIEILHEQKDALVRDITESFSSLHSLEALLTERCTEMRELVVSLAVMRQALRHSDYNLKKSRQDVTVLQGQLLSLRCELEDKVASLQVRDADLAALEISLTEMSKESAAARCIPEYQRQLQSLEEELHDLRAQHQITCESLSRTQNDLQERIQVQQLGDAKLQDNLCARHAVEVGQLEERLKHTSQELSNATQLLQITELRLAEVQQDNQESSGRITALMDEVEKRSGMEDSESALRINRTEELDVLQTTLSSTRDELVAAKQECQRLVSLVEQSTRELEQVKQAHTDALQYAEQQIHELQDDRQEKATALEANERDLRDLRSSLDEQSREQELLRIQLQEEIACRKRDRVAIDGELSSYAELQARSDSLQTELRQANEAIQWQLEQAEAESSSLREEKQTLQMETTNLEAEIQRSVSLTRYLENQVLQNEISNSSLKETLEGIQTRLAQSEKAGKAAELSLALEIAQHDKAMASLQRELDKVRSEPKLDDIVAELEEKNREMDQLLQSKCAEIETYDDRILETLKANRKLSTKVEALTRKVQSLQGKLASAKVPVQTPPVNPVVSSSQPLAPPPVIIPTTRMPVFTDPELILGRDQPMSNTSPALRSQTPERMSGIVQTESPESEVPRSAGKKRRAPDHDERESVPPEGRYTSDSVVQPVTTPRLRKTLHVSRTGFTPARSGRNILGLPSPGRRATTTISDVTNSPRSASNPQTARSSSKRTWLGKIKGGVSQSNSSNVKVVTSRENVLDKMPESLESS